MFKIALMLLRNKKINFIYTLLFVILNLLISLFYISHIYHNYIYNICLNYRENREYAIFTLDKNIMSNIKNNFAIENEEITTDALGQNIHYVILLKNGSDRSSFERYLENNNIEGHLANTEKLNELEKIENQVNMFNCFLIFILILSFIISLLLIKNIIINLKKHLFLLKALGYNRFQLNFILFLKLFIIILLSILVTHLLIYLAHFFYIFINEQYLKTFFTNINILKISIVYIIIILLSLITSLLINLFKYKKIQY